MKAEIIVAKGKERYLADELLQEASDSLQMKLGEAANRLTKMGYSAPEGIILQEAIANRNWLIHQYDQIDREITWVTLSRDLPKWGRSLQPEIAAAQRVVKER